MIEDPGTPVVATPRRRLGLRIFITLSLIGVIGTGATVAYASWALGGSETGAPVRVIVDKGESGATIAAKLERAKVVRSAFVFRLMARSRGVAAQLKPGAYDLRQHMSVSAVIDILRRGIPLKVFRFTIPEGKVAFEIARIIERDTPISAKAFTTALRSGKHRLPLMPRSVTNLEGLLFPKTYEIVEKTTADQLVEILLAQFVKETAGLDLAAGAKRLGITPYEAIVVASLVEREARVAKDRPLVASVIYNRLARPMRLQIDATVQYAIYVQTGVYRGEALTQEEYTSVRSPYNTYLIDGLPPTPIGAPGVDAIRAALHPATTEYYFYRLKSGTAEHCFSRDSAGHQACANA